MPFSAWLHDGYLRFADAPYRAAPHAPPSLGRAALIANVDIAAKDKRHALAQHYYEPRRLRELLAEAEAAPVLRALSLSPEAAHALVRRRVREACAAAARALRPTVGGGRGHWLLLGVDLVVDARLDAHVLELNLNPELTLDAVRTRLNRRLARRLFALLLEAHRAARPLFPTGGARGCEHGAAFTPAAANSTTGRKLLQTEVKGWQLLYTEAVAPTYCAAPQPRCGDTVVSLR